MKLLSQINFKSIKVLHLSDNNITNLTPLASAPFRQLKELYLFGNNISNIDILEQFPFKTLEVLSLGGNKIEDISGKKEENKIEENNEQQEIMGFILKKK